MLLPYESPYRVKQMTREEQELAAALRERLKIISDESSRRNPNQHMARLRVVGLPAVDGLSLAARIERATSLAPSP